jgi:hypothetical protein
LYLATRIATYRNRLLRQIIRLLPDLLCDGKVNFIFIVIMPNIQRSPPHNTSVLSGSRSETDLLRESTTDATISKFDTHITTRTKRQRMETSPPNTSTRSSSDKDDLRNDLLNLLSNWKEDQDRRLDEWKTNLDATLSKLVSEVTYLKKECQEIKKTNMEIEKGMEFFNKVQEETGTKVKEIENSLKYNTNAINITESQIQDIQFQTRHATLEIRNIPISENETFDSLFSSLSKICKAMELTINDADIRDLYRLPGKLGVLRPIVVEFTRVQTRNALLTRVRKFNRDKPVSEKLNTQIIGLSGVKNPIYIDEHLGPSQRKLMYETRQFSKKHNYSCWTSNGRILLRTDSAGKPVIIHSEKCLSDLVKKM